MCSHPNQRQAIKCTQGMNSAPSFNSAQLRHIVLMPRPYHSQATTEWACLPLVLV